MKKLVLLPIFIFLIGSVFAHVTFEGGYNKVRVIFDNSELRLDQEELYQTIALPSRDIEISVKNCEVSVFSQDGNLLETKRINGTERVRVEKSFVMRNLFAHRLKIDIIKSEDNNRSVIKNIEIDLISKDKVNVPDKISMAFLPVYKSLVDNFDRSYLRDAVVVPSKMLIITRENLVGNLQSFTDWKNAKGISTEIACIEDIGNTNAQIKAYIQNIYNYEEIPPDFILLTGDINGSYAIPSFFISNGSENDVTDHPYTLLDGDDYFPEMIIGRMSFDTLAEFRTIREKILHYEKEPYMGSTHWFENACLVAGNYSPTPPIPSTPVKVTQWLRDKMLNYGYNEIDEIYYPQIDPGTYEITSSINGGVSIVSYRGWGDANGWHHPYFHTNDVGNLDNGFYLPVITSFVCNTGDFANDVDPCFGEKWLIVGSPSIPKGGVVFVGPSDLHTNTKYNNSIFSGFYAGMLDEDILTFGSAVLRGKLELYNNFPLNREPGDKVEFYFHVYNILGDPSLTMWSTVPQTINCTLPDSLNKGTNYLEIDLPDLEGGIVTAKMVESIFSMATVENGQATLYFNLENSDQIEITITKPNYHPFIDTLDVVSENIDIGLYDFDTIGSVISGENIQLALTLKNYGSQTVNSVSADLSCDSQEINLITSSANFGDLDPGETSTQNYEVEILPSCPDNTVIEFTLDISDGNTAKFEVIVSGLLFEVTGVTVNDENGVLDPFEESDISVTIENIGTFNAVGLQAELVAITTDATITSSQFTIGNISIDETGTADFTVLVSGECHVGRSIPFRIDISDENLLETSAYFNLEVGEIDNRAPTGPDIYGYYAYDNFDVSYLNAPAYQWFEIDPLEGGDGTVILMGDDVSETIAMPFDFPFYGVVSDSLTICSNGWISIQPTWETYFRNWNIPSALGPYGMIAPYWDDLIGHPIGDEHEPMRICYYYNTELSIFIIEWNKCVNRYDDTSVEKFELVLYDPAVYLTADGNGEFQFNYQTINNPDVNSNYCTVGIENFNQSDGLLYTYANIYPSSATSLQNNLAIKFSTDPPEFTDPSIPIADFLADITGGIAPLEVNFTDNSTPAYFFNSFEWDFGDDSPISTYVNPVHIYTEPGSYDVTLTVTNTAGADTNTKEDYIVVYPSENLIWPGDTNYDGIVTEDDIISIGIYWREVGTPRPSISFEWTGNNYPENWDEPLASLADCNGNGEVNITDVLGICLNWNFTHTVVMCAPPAAGVLEEYRENFVELYNSLGNSGIELLLKNHIAELFDLPVIETVLINRLSQNYPNPFNPVTNISYSISTNGQVELSIFNIKGQMVKKLVNEYQSAGNYSITWNGKDSSSKQVSSGLYFYRLKSNGKVIDTKKMLLLK